jgi:hypothetical protein
MRPRLLTCFLFAVIAIALVATTTSDVFAQTQQLNKTLERKFPVGQCPLDTNFLGTFVTNTGIIQLTFLTRGDDDAGDAKSGDVAVAFDQVIDDVSIIEASEFAANSVEDDNCYFDGPPFLAVFTGALLNNPKVPFYDALDPSTSPCPWDETDGVVIDTGALRFTGDGGGDGILTTSVIISGLTPGTPYVLHGSWLAFNFNLPNDCVPPAACLDVTIDDVPNSCGTLSTETKTWGAVKALYHD